MNITLLLMLMLPVIGSALLYKFTPKEISLPSAGGGLIAGLIVVGAVFGFSYGSAVSDTEIINGKITGKERVHDTYEESYSCNCRSESYRNSDGSSSSRTVCDTCYRTHYTVHWNCSSTVGGYTIDSEDSLSSLVYGYPDPRRWLIIQNGDPVARQHSYTNYVQAVPNSLFAQSDQNLMNGFKPLLVEYPGNVYDFYHIDRFITPGFSFADAPQWNADIAKMLIDLGPAKQVNVVIAVAKTGDRAYTSALRTKWEGANKNDVVLVIGSLDGQKMEFVDVITWSKNEIFKVQLIDRIQSIGIISRPQIIEVLQSQIAKNFERRRMREFEYLKGEIDPSGTTIAVTIAILVIGYGAGIMLVTGKLDALINRRPGRRRF